ARLSGGAAARPDRAARGSRHPGCALPGRGIGRGGGRSAGGGRVRLTRLTLTNFRQHADTDLQLGSGLTGVIGPNGSGKSTLLEAIAWAIYGTPAVRGSRDGIRFHRAPPRSSVRVDLAFDLGRHRFRVSRGLTSAELFL